jgi:hypothetical protein
MAQAQASGARVRDEKASGEMKSVTNRETDAVEKGVAADDQAAKPSAEEIAMRAYECWHERGCPDGSPEVDWSRAENELKSAKTPERSRAAGV